MPQPPQEESVEAYEKWDALTTAIQEGQPGYGEFDEFSFVDNWLDLLKDYEKYWTENCPYVFYFEKPQRTELNRETKTANYEFSIILYENPKFTEIEKIVTTGLEKSYEDDWNMDYLKNWPFTSVYADKKYDEKYLIDGVALASSPLAQDLDYKDDFENDKECPYFASSKLQKELGKVSYWAKDLVWTKRRPAFRTGVFQWKYVGKKCYNFNYYDWESSQDNLYFLYDIKFNITDKNGKVLLQSGRRNIESKTKYEFKNVPQEIMNLIESNSINIVINEMYLAYGRIAGMAVEGSRDWLKPLPELKIKNYINDSWLINKNRESVLSESFIKFLKWKRQTQEEERLAQLEIEKQAWLENEQIRQREEGRKAAKDNMIKEIMEALQNETVLLSNYNDWVKYSESTSKKNIKSNKKQKSLIVQKIRFNSITYNSHYLYYFYNIHDNEKQKKELCNILSEYEGLEKCYSESGEFDESKNGWRVKFDTKDNSKSFIYRVIE